MEKFDDCDYCARYMNYGASCSPSLLHNALIYRRILYKDKEGHFCHDCNVAPGQFHHLGCDMERCPICGEQLISCGCFDEEECHLSSIQKLGDTLATLKEGRKEVNGSRFNIRNRIE